MADVDILDHRTVRALLGNSEQRQHPWPNYHSLDFSKPLLRTWDANSGSKPDTVGQCMKSRAPRALLNTYEHRKQSLTIHVNHHVWTPTPYISFTDSPAAVENLIYMRAHRGTQTVTAINPRARREKGLPILELHDEMEYYGVEDPYHRNNQYYHNHYLCLWEVTEDEIVGHWTWSEIVQTKNWYNEIVLPAFQEHDAQTEPPATILGVDTAGNLLADPFTELSSKLCSSQRIGVHS